MRSLVTIGALLLLCPAVNRGQVFDVVSVKENTFVTGAMDELERAMWTGNLRPGPRNGRLRLTAVPVSLLIELAYNVTARQVIGGPGWIHSTRFDVDARLPATASWEDARPMLRSLLADRFNLSLRHESRRLPAYALTTARGGAKLDAVTDEFCANAPAMEFGGPLTTCGGHRRVFVQPPPDTVLRIEAVGIRTPLLTEWLTAEVGRLVIDKTGVTNRFRMSLEFTPFGSRGADGVSIFTALQEQLGLRLMETEADVEVLVVDKADRPSPN